MKMSTTNSVSKFYEGFTRESDQLIGPPSGWGIDLLDSFFGGLDPAITSNLSSKGVFVLPDPSTLHYASEVRGAIDYIKQAAELEQASVLATVNALSSWLDRDTNQCNHQGTARTHFSTGPAETRHDDASYDSYDEEAAQIAETVQRQQRVCFAPPVAPPVPVRHSRVVPSHYGSPAERTLARYTHDNRPLHSIGDFPCPPVNHADFEIKVLQLFCCFCFEIGHAFRECPDPGAGTPEARSIFGRNYNHMKRINDAYRANQSRSTATHLQRTHLELPPHPDRQVQRNIENRPAWVQHLERASAPDTNEGPSSSRNHFAAPMFVCRANTVSSHSALPISGNASVSPFAIATDSLMPHVTLVIGTNGNVAPMLAMYDTGAGVTSGELNHHRNVMTNMPSAVYAYFPRGSAVPVELSGITSKDGSAHAIFLWDVVLYNTPFASFKLAVALGKDVTVPTILGLADQKSLQMYLQPSPQGEGDIVRSYKLLQDFTVTYQAPVAVQPGIPALAPAAQFTTAVTVAPIVSELQPPSITRNSPADIIIHPESPVPNPVTLTTPHLRDDMPTEVPTENSTVVPSVAMQFTCWCSWNRESAQRVAPLSHCFLIQLIS
jgi:hypothetical protein